MPLHRTHLLGLLLVVVLTWFNLNSNSSSKSEIVKKFDLKPPLPPTHPPVKHAVKHAEPSRTERMFFEQTKVQLLSYQNKLSIAATKGDFSEIYRPFPEPKEYPVGMPAAPKCVNVSNMAFPVPCEHETETCRDYECFSKCTANYKKFECMAHHGSTTACCGQTVATKVSPQNQCQQDLPECVGFDQLTGELGQCRKKIEKKPTQQCAASFGNTGDVPEHTCPQLWPDCVGYEHNVRWGECVVYAQHGCPSHTPACLPQGYCVPWARVEYQQKIDDMTIGHLRQHGCTTEQNMSDFTEKEEELRCTTAQQPMCIGYEAGARYGTCAPVYPSHHHALWQSWNGPQQQTVFDVVIQSLCESSRLFKLAKRELTHTLQQLDVGKTGVCETMQTVVGVLRHKAQSVLAGWEWECRPQRRKFYNLLRWDMPGSHALAEPLMDSNGLKPVELWTADCQECNPEPGWKEKFTNWLEHDLSTVDVLLHGHRSKTINDKLDFTNLPTDFVYHSCAGCMTTYCSKRGLCEIALHAGLNGKIGPKCIMLPNGPTKEKYSGVAQLEQSFKNKTHKTNGWAIKFDGATMHLGVGTRIVRTEEEFQEARLDFFPEAWNAAENDFVAQEYIQPFLGKGIYQRKFEIRVYVLVTSTDPLRVYTFDESFVLIAFSAYSNTTNTSGPSWCMHDTHLFREGSDACQTDGLGWVDRTFTFERWRDAYGVTLEQGRVLKQNYETKIKNAILASHTSVAQEPMNIGISHSKARCFSLLRADVAVGADLEPYLMEINQDPYIPHAFKIQPLTTLILRQFYQEMFAMIGVIKEWRSVPSVELAVRLTEFCHTQSCSAREYLALQRMDYEESQMAKFTRVFPTKHSSLEEAQRWRQLLPSSQQQFDEKVQQWIKYKHLHNATTLH